MESPGGKGGGYAESPVAHAWVFSASWVLTWGDTPALLRAVSVGHRLVCLSVRLSICPDSSLLQPAQLQNPPVALQVDVPTDQSCGTGTLWTLSFSTRGSLSTFSTFTYLMAYT